MYLYFYYFSIPFLMISCVLITLTSTPIFMWMIMELNLICFINIISIYKYSFSQILMNYFLINTFNSYLFLFSSLMTNMKFMNVTMNFIIIISLLSKMGMPPFQAWYINFMKHLNWNLFFMNSSIQKFIPLFIIYSITMKNNMYYLIYMILILTSIPIMAFNCHSMKIMMSFSSIIQMAWIMILMKFNEIMWFLFFMIYNLISFSIIYMFKTMNLIFTFDLTSTKFNPKMTYNLNFLVLSLMSLPPFTGFMNKWMFMNYMSNEISYMYLFMMTLYTVMNVYFYSRIMIFNTLIYSSSTNLNVKNLNYKFNFMKLNLLLLIAMLFIYTYELI
uniref:NADH-ubiquinone oxidoreductase chain 2 n=1 Tax=Diaphorencyrtus aligarhensis TaxID=436678 RepID=A0A6C0M9Z3_9HYME|nr:NADH dehydrogenase subunit 2 [Diaphorencyrtus aligarhensis]QHU77265.1 NADH dehydrogenase subunit 2 [Diaphorencyrtus aligarhensis]